MSQPISVQDSLSMQARGGKCVFSSEWNAYSQKTYFSNFGDFC